MIIKFSALWSRMGSILSVFRKPKKIVILGPRQAGKTTVLEQLAVLNKIKPKINAHKHFNFIRLKNYNAWDLAGEDDMLSWSYYYDNASCVIFVYDADNAGRSEKLLKELCFAKELRVAMLLIVINKMTDGDQNQRERIAKIVKRRPFYCVNIAKNGNFSALSQGFEWLAKNS